MRCIYIDETGRAHEPVAVVLGVIAQGDRQVVPAMREVYAAIKELVPTEVLQKGFVYHTKDLLSRKYESQWKFEDRIALIHRILAVPKKLRLPLALSLCVKDKIPPNADLEGLSKDHSAHAVAFRLCIAEFCRYLRDYAGELGVVFAEDTDSVKTSIKRSITSMKKTPRRIQPLRFVENSRELPTDPSLLGAGEILGQVNWTAKDEAALLWVADACAHALRRLVCRQSHGEEMSRTILNDELVGHLTAQIDGLVAAGAGSILVLEDPPRPTGRLTYSVSVS